MTFTVDASKRDTVSEQQIVNFCKDETERKSGERIDDRSSARRLVFELRKVQRYSNATKSSHEQWFRYKSKMYQVAAAGIKISLYSTGARRVRAHILPSTCVVKFPDDGWFSNAKSVWISAVSPRDGELGVFRMTLRKYVDTGDGAVEMFDVDDNLVDMTC